MWGAAGQAGAAGMLLAAGASSGAVAGTTGRTALHLAADSGHTDVVLQLLQGVRHRV